MLGRLTGQKARYLNIELGGGGGGGEGPIVPKNLATIVGEDARTRSCGWPTPARRINISRQGKNTGAKWGEDKHEDVSGGFEKLVRKQQGVLKKRFTRGRIVIITQYNWWYLVNDVLSSTRLVKAYLIYVY